VISGKAYLVQNTRGSVPRQLGDFTGEGSVVIDLDGDEYTIWGSGVQAEDGVRLFEKSDEGVGKDIRVWVVCQGGEGFTAMPAGVDVPSCVVGAVTPGAP
jgi:hypothetical protein